MGVFPLHDSADFLDARRRICRADLRMQGLFIPTYVVFVIFCVHCSGQYAVKG